MQSAKCSDIFQKDFNLIISSKQTTLSPNSKIYKEQIYTQKSFRNQPSKAINQIQRIEAFFKQKLRQKQYQLKIIQNEIEQEAQQRFYQYQNNLNLEQKFKEMSRTSQSLDKNACITTEQFILSEELQRLKQEFHECSKLLQFQKKKNKMLKKEQVLLRQDLRMGFKRRRQNILGKSMNKIQNSKISLLKVSGNYSQKYEMYQHKTHKKRINQHQSYSKRNISSYNQQNQTIDEIKIERINEKQQLVKLYYEFQYIKQKVEQNIRQKNVTNKKQIKSNEINLK